MLSNNRNRKLFNSKTNRFRDKGYEKHLIHDVYQLNDWVDTTFYYSFHTFGYMIVWYNKYFIVLMQINDCSWEMVESPMKMDSIVSSESLKVHRNENKY
jgi:hypothetical protein